MSQEQVNRKLTAILSSNVAGYSHLMKADEVWAIKSLETNKMLMRQLIEDYKGRIIDIPGDNLFVKFSSIINAVECAVMIQQELKARNGNLVESCRMHFRIGINLGDVVEEAGRLYGNGVDIVARLEELAELGGICISGTVYEQIISKLDFGYEFLGEYIVKNITAPVPVYSVLMGADTAGKVIGEQISSGKSVQNKVLGIVLILILIAAGLLLWNQPGKVEEATNKPAPAPLTSDIKKAPKTKEVLLLEKNSSDPGPEYFLDGLSEELTSLLKERSDDIIVILENKDLDDETKKGRIEDIIKRIVDFQIMSKLALGRETWTAMTKEDQEIFEELFTKILMQAYLNKIVASFDWDIIIKETEQVTQKTVSISAFIISKDQKISVLCKFFQSSIGWKIYDVEIEGVSLLRSYRGQFKSILKEETIKELMDKMEGKIQPKI